MLTLGTHFPSLIPCTAFPCCARSFHVLVRRSLHVLSVLAAITPNESYTTLVPTLVSSTSTHVVTSRDFHSDFSQSLHYSSKMRRNSQQNTSSVSVLRRSF